MKNRKNIDKAQKHHYVPRFYLAKWGVDGGAFCWVHTKTEFNEVKIGTKAPRALAFEPGLYETLPERYPFDTSASNTIEDDFFSKIDNTASQIHLKLIAEGIASLTVAEKNGWVLFINSLLERRPKRIKEVLAQTQNEVPQIIAGYKQSLEQNPELFEQITKILDFEALTRNSVLSGMVRWICDRETLQYFINMQWVIITQPNGKDHFLTGDNPIVVNACLEEKNPVYVMSIALSPTKLLIMHAQKEEFDESFARTLAALHNFLIASQTEKYLVSSKVLDNEGQVKNKKILDMIYSNKFESTGRLDL